MQGSDVDLIEKLNYNITYFKIYFNDRLIKHHQMPS